MTAKKTTKSYPSRIVYLWQVCLQNQLNLECDTHGQAVHLRQHMYAYRKLAREEGLPEAVFMDDYQLNIEKMSNGQVFLIGKLSVIGQRINNLLQKAMNEGEGEQQPSHHNPISLTPSGIPMQQPEALKPVVNSEQALKAIQEDPLMKLLRRESE